MIFVTVGTHEQQFNRLISKIDEMVELGDINEEVVIQTGFSDYCPKNCKYSKFIPYNDMLKYIKEARIVITHGGPATFIMPLQIRKIPIVVPRQCKFGEHINDHQVEFAQMVAERQKNIILINDINELNKVVKGYDKIIDSMPNNLVSNNSKFNLEFKKIVEEVIKED